MIDKQIESYIKQRQKLNQLYTLCMNQTDSRGFFTHLYNYLEVLHKDRHVIKAIFEINVRRYAQDHPELKIVPNANSTINEYIDYMNITFNGALNDYRGPTRFYYCWIRLMIFYSYYNEPSVSIKNNELINIFKLNDDSNNKTFSRSNYHLYLEVFHAQFNDWITSITKHGGEYIDDSSVINEISSPRFLPKIITVVNDDFAVHEGDIISYKGIEIPLEMQVRKVIAHIMKRSVENSYSPSDLLAASDLSGSHEYSEPEKYIVKIVSEARKSFREITNNDLNYFPHKRDRGYTFLR